MRVRARSLARCLTAGVAIATCLALTTPGSASAAPGTKAAPGTSPLGALPGSYTVTLVTGDKVTITPAPNGNEAVEIIKAKGRERVPFVGHKTATGFSVMPTDVWPLIGANKIDPRLFDVALLHNLGYDDAHTTELPLLLTGGTSAAPAALAGSRAVRTLPELALTSVREQKASAGSFWSAFTTGSRALRPAVKKLWLVGKMHPTLDVSVPQIGAPEAWKAGYTGDGVTVAVIDTGVDETHPDLKGVVKDAVDFTGSAAGPKDEFGHGTHVASIVAGRGTASDGKYTGVAKGATVVSAKVCDAGGGCPEDAIINGMQWAAHSGARIANMSLGGPPGDGDDLLAVVLNYFSKRYGTLFVVAAGNNGEKETIGSPGTADEAITVGSVDKGTENLSDFSSRGPRVTLSRRGDYGLKPDITAPGGDIVAARADGTWMGEPVGDFYTRASGTSMATPHVAGSAAILASQHPEWRAEQLKGALMSSAKPNPKLGYYDQGAGRVDVGTAVHRELIATGSLNLGYFPWPGTDAPEVTKSITYTNYAASAVTIKLALTATDENGKPAARGLFTLGSTTVTVPAAGSVDVPVTVHPMVGTVGLYGGAVTATAGNAAVVARTIVGAYKEPEAYNLTSLLIPRSGRDIYTELMLMNAKTGEFRFHYFYGTTFIQRLSAGNWVASMMSSEQPLGPGDEPGTVIDVQPVAMTKAGSHELTFDGRKAKQVTFRSQKDPEATVMHTTTVMSAFAAAGQRVVVPYWDFKEGVYMVPGKTAVPAFTWGLTTTLIKPGSGWRGNRGGPASPYTYSFVLTGKGTYPANPAYVATPSNVATVTQNLLHRQSADEGRQIYTMHSTPASGGIMPTYGVYTRNLTKRTDYFVTGPGGTSSTWLLSGLDNPTGEPDFDQLLRDAQQNYPPGKAFTRNWDSAVFGPSFGQPGSAPTRTGEAIKGTVGLIGDTEQLGQDIAAAEHATLTRNGVVVWEGDSTKDIAATVPAAAGAYTLSATFEREHAWTKFSSHVDAEWTFRSAHTTAAAALPLQVVRFRPDLEADNSAPSGEFTVPLQVERAPGAAAATVKSVSLEVSYDGGRTWAAVKLVGTGVSRTGRVTNPAGGSVSLRAVATDSAGNTVKQTIIGAYLVR